MFHWSAIILFVLVCGLAQAVTPAEPYPREELFTGPKVRTFSGRDLSEIAFPIGGIGTGTISLGGRGDLRDWEVFNRPGKGKDIPFSFFAIWAQEGRGARSANSRAEAAGTLPGRIRYTPESAHGGQSS